MADPQRPALGPDNPWPGLDSFDERDRDYFHGRTAESAELLRLVRRELLTVLFGRSGLGKTSLLKAGLFPLLREEDRLPVYIRLDHADGAPELREQIYRELQAACDADRVQAAQPVDDETLWSFFHRRDVEFWSERNRPVTPVIVFDQFEEIFTLGQETEESRVRSDAFLAELGDLIENRPPDAVRQALEDETTAARRFDFKHSTVKLMLSFREDFLAEIEGLKEQMPSLMYNRFRLLAMNGTQAYEVITRAGGTLVGDEVARQIIRLAWKNEPSPLVDPSDFPKIEIDPALLSVVCTELNHKRQQANPPLGSITPALLEGADREILSGFYERGMAGLDPRVRTFVEDELITNRGYRDSHALEDALAVPGITSEALDTLIRRRLLRVDERQSVRRVELTHDVLTRVVRESRDTRRTREAGEAAKAREQAALEQQQRNRRNSVLLLAGALVVILLIALTGWFALKARRAGQQAIELLREAESIRLMANADRLQDIDYGASLLVDLAAVGLSSPLEVSAALLQRFASHPHLSAFLPGQKDPALGVTFSPDGKLLASASAGQTVVLWDMKTHRPMGMLKGHKGGVYSVAFSPDGKLLASASGDQTVILWDVESRKSLATLQGHKGSVYSVAFSPDGKRLASASKDHSVIVWDVESRMPLATLQGHKDAVSGVAFSPDGKQLASAGLDKTVILWDVASRKPLTTLHGHKRPVLKVAFSQDGKRLASASGDYTVILWDLEKHNSFATLKGHTAIVTGIAFSPDGRQLASASWDKTLILWDVDSCKPLATLRGHKDPVEDVAFSPDGKRIASASMDTLILWDVESRRPLATLGHKDAVNSVAFSPDGKQLASAGWDKTVTLWDLESRRPLATLLGHKDRVYSVAFSADGKQLASAGWDGAVILWDVNNRKPLTRLEAHRGFVLAVAFSPDGTRLASANWDTTVVLWDVNSRKPLATLEGHRREVFGVAFSPDGKRLASASWDGSVILWDLGSRKPLATLRGRRGAVLGVAFSPNGKQLASANGDLWDVDSYRLLATLEGHKGIVYGITFSPEGERLASASGDKTVILWDIKSRKPLASLEGHKDAVYGVAFSPDGKRMASASRDKTVILWDVDLNLSHLMTEACFTANRNLTCEEWRSYIGADKPYRKVCPALPGPERCD